MKISDLKAEQIASLSPGLYSRHHIASFNELLDRGLKTIIQKQSEIHIAPKLVKTPISSIKFWLEGVSVGAPWLKPFEARLGSRTYSAPLQTNLMIMLGDSEVHSQSVTLGEIPIMLMSKNCLLTEHEGRLEELKEDNKEPGGYFIVNGLEKILRNIIVPRKNYVIAESRPTFSNQHKSYSDYAVFMKCSGAGYRCQSIHLHYSVDGNIFMGLRIGKVLVIPVMVVFKALVDYSDAKLLQLLGADLNAAASFRALYMIEDLRRRGLNDQSDCLKYLGVLMRDLLGFRDSKISDSEVGQAFLSRHVMIQIESTRASEKARALAFMIKKLWTFVEGQCLPDNMDSMVNQEILTSGHLYGAFLAEKIRELMQAAKFKFIKDMNRRKEPDNAVQILISALDSQKHVLAKKIEYFLATGNLKSHSGLDLKQTSGFAIIAERLNNARFWSHLRSIHRGAYFVEMKTTKVRKLLPDCWGYLCPVHTPDGSLCGLLNHLSLGCMPQSKFIFLNREQRVLLTRVLNDCGMIEDFFARFDLLETVPVILDGQVLGVVPIRGVDDFTNELRSILKCGFLVKKHARLFRTQKNQGLLKNLPNSFLEICQNLSITSTCKSALGLKGVSAPQFPGVFLSLSEGRPLRKVFNLTDRLPEMIDPLEQSYLLIATNEKEISSLHTHCEINVDFVLNDLACQIPFLVHNQSPRNMYQCQMAKQTMGSSTFAETYRADTKMYRLYAPQDPIVASTTHSQLGFDDFPSGVNAVVAVLSYTGYDIEDAMIINKAAYERGFMHGVVTKTLQTNFGKKDGPKKPHGSLLFQNEEYTERLEGLSRARDFDDGNQEEYDSTIKVDVDGLPKVGVQLRRGDEYFKYVEKSTHSTKRKFYKDAEAAYVESVSLSSAPENPKCSAVNVKLRYPRNPVTGDKFSSRHGQKGVMSMLWPQRDMPFNEQGLSPDIIINPNAFPSRMTIGMLIESLVSKTSALKGTTYRGDSFKPCDWKDVAKDLHSAGFNRLGTELLYSGVYGVPMKAEIYQGIVYYQRLRHMVKDKAQARATGPTDALTRQPVKGRKKGGGIRFGEMERDALIAYGVAEILNDRLKECSDKSDGFVCEICGDLLAAFEQNNELFKRTEMKCLFCQQRGSKGRVRKVQIPYILRYLTSELAAMNIRLKFSLSQKG